LFCFTADFLQYWARSKDCMITICHSTAESTLMILSNMSFIINFIIIIIQNDWVSGLYRLSGFFLVFFMIFNIYNSGLLTESRSPVIQNVIHHR
jgi:hypothetical protein